MNTKSVLACTAVVVAFAVIAAPFALSSDAFAANFASQIISSSQSNTQSSSSVGLINYNSGNNYNTQTSTNFGSNFLSQVSH